MRRPKYDDDIQMREAFVNWILSRPPSYEPRLKFSYSNFGYGLVGAVLEKEYERIYGLTDDYVRKSFNEINQESLKGLGMEDNYGTKNGHAGTFFPFLFSGHSRVPLLSHQVHDLTWLLRYFAMSQTTKN